MKSKIIELTNNLVLGNNGIYYSRFSSNVSYPEDGNDSCLLIEENSYWFNHRNNVIAANIKKYNKEKVFFDIGGGNGFVSKRMQDEGFDVFLVEPGEKGAINSYKRGVKNVICSTLENAGFSQKSIYSVGLFDVVEHIEDDCSFLKDINFYMKDKGYIYITVPAFDFLWSEHDVLAGHFKRYTINKINRLLNECGFEVTYSTYIFSILPLPVFLFRVLIPNIFYKKRNTNKVIVNQNDYTIGNRKINRIMKKIWRWELNRIMKNKKIPFGGSCFIVGKKLNQYE